MLPDLESLGVSPDVAMEDYYRFILCKKVIKSSSPDLVLNRKVCSIPTATRTAISALHISENLFKMGRVDYQKYAMQLLAVSHLFVGVSFTAETSTSGWALQSFVTEPDFLPPVFDINKTGTTYDAYIFLDTNTNGVASGNLVATIIDDDGQLIWSAGYSETTNPSLQTYSEYFSWPLATILAILVTQLTNCRR